MWIDYGIPLLIRNIYPVDTVVLCWMLSGSCFCHPEYYCCISRLLFPMVEGFLRVWEGSLHLVLAWALEL